jgi:uncharacterized protein (TIGR02598 family)
MKSSRHSRDGFSLVEVVLALGVVSFAIVAMLGVISTGLQTSHLAQDETRAAQIAQSIFASLASQAQTQFNNAQLQLSDNSTMSFDLSSSAAAAKTLYADNGGTLVPNASGAVYAITVRTNGSSTGFDATYANQVTLSVAWPASAAAANQTKRDFVRIISKY